MAISTAIPVSSLLPTLSDTPRICTRERSIPALAATASLKPSCILSVKSDTVMGKPTVSFITGEVPAGGGNMTVELQFEPVKP